MKFRTDLVPINIVFTDVGGDIVNQIIGENWTHVLIELTPGLYYEATWPVVKKGNKYPARRELRLTLLVTSDRRDKMLAYAESKLGTRYNFWGYFFPRWYNKTKGIYCSQYACQVLRAGDVNIPIGAGYSPDKLLKAIRVYCR